jgi:hypothetical protein
VSEPDIAAQQDAAAEQHMARVDEQFQAHDYQQMMAEAANRAVPEQQQEMER